jgi:phospholipid/cholesterol/gamma-HCH transport system substrate-binding protein
VIRRSTKVQLLVFVALTLLGVSYISANYIGLPSFLLGARTCTVTADLSDSGGIFTSAEVTLRGVAIGKVGALQLTPDGVQVELDLASCDHPLIPADTEAVVTDLSAVGEQYMNLIPPDSKGPYLREHSVIPVSHTKLPIATQVLLTNLDNLANSVNDNNLGTVITELGTAFNGQGGNLQRLLDAGNQLLVAAQKNFPATESLIKTASTVLATQLKEGSALQSWAHNLNLLTAQLKASDPTIRSLLTNAPSDLDIVNAFVKNNAGDLGVLLANLDTTGQIISGVVDPATGQLSGGNLSGIEVLLEAYPGVIAGGETVGQSGTARLGMVLQSNYNDPPDCEPGYQATVKRLPSDTAPAAPNTAAQCTLPPSSGTDVRGAANAPGGDPVYAGPAGVFPRAVTANTVKIGDTFDSAAALGDKSWLALLENGLH